MKLIDVTGKVPLVPACPSHKHVALIPEPRAGAKMAKIIGYWRCPIDNKVYQSVPEGFPTPLGGK